MPQPDVASPAALAAENQRLKALLGLVGVLADPEKALADKLAACVGELARLTGAEQASIMLVEGDSLVVAAATNPAIVGLGTPLGESTISTQVVCTGQPLCLADVQNSPFAGLSRGGDRSSYRTRSLISLPLLENGLAVGVLNLSDKRGSQAFVLADLELAQGVANQVSGLVHFSALHSRLQAAYHELHRAQQAKDDMTYLIHHDMKAPLTAVKEILGLLRPESALEAEERAQFLALAEGDLELLWRRVTNLLDLSRMDQGRLPLQPGPVRLDQLAGEARQRLLAVSRVRGVEVELKLEAEPEVQADEDLVERILINLLFNALKFSSPEEGGGGWTELKVALTQGQALVEVTDSGPGVDPLLGQAVFERFVQGGVSRGSTGLGLYFCRRAARLLGGEVSFVNLPLGGARFTFSLPLLTA